MTPSNILLYSYQCLIQSSLERLSLAAEMECMQRHTVRHYTQRESKWEVFIKSLLQGIPPTIKEEERERF